MRLGAYQLLERIGLGGMAEVFLAVPLDDPDGEQVVVKRSLPELLDRAEILEMFRDEMRISSLLHHRNIVSVRDFDEEEGVPYLVFEYVEGLTLSRLLRKMEGRRLPIPLATWIAAEACAGLAYAHRRKLTYSSQPLGIVHRDISPENILLSVQGEVKLADFGVAKAVTRLTQTSPGEVKGKYGYMSPEQCRSDGEIDLRSDIFSVAAVLYEMSTGSPLFGTFNPTEILKGLIYGDYVPPEKRVADYPADLARIVSRALRWEPDERYQDARDMRQDLILSLPAEPDPAAELAALIARVRASAPPGGGVDELRESSDTDVDAAPSDALSSGSDETSD